MNGANQDRGPGLPALSWRECGRRALPIWVISQLAYFSIAGIATRFRSATFNTDEYGLAWIFGAYAHYDTGHFARIAQHGYLSRGRADVAVAFFPGYPITARWVARVLSFGRASQLDYLSALALVAWFGTAMSAVVLWRYLAEESGTRTATIGTVMLFSGPYSLFFVASYSEGPFLAFGLASWYCAKNQRWLLAAVFCSVASLIRVNGLFLIAGVAVMYVVEQRRYRRPVLGRTALVIFLPIAAVASYVLWTRIATGHADAWFLAQKRGWNRQLEWPWQTLMHSIHNARDVSFAAPEHLQAIAELLFAVLYLFIIQRLWAKRMWPELTYVGLTAFSLLTSSFYQSVPRSLIVCFPVYTLLAKWWVNVDSRWRRVTLALLSISFAVINAALFVRGYDAD